MRDIKTKLYKYLAKNAGLSTGKAISSQHSDALSNWLRSFGTNMPNELVAAHLGCRRFSVRHTKGDKDLCHLVKNMIFF